MTTPISLQRPTFQEGFDLDTCTQALKTLVNKIAAACHWILQTILPCFFSSAQPATSGRVVATPASASSGQSSAPPDSSAIQIPATNAQPGEAAASRLNALQIDTSEESGSDIDWETVNVIAAAQLVRGQSYDNRSLGRQDLGAAAHVMGTGDLSPYLVSPSNSGQSSVAGSAVLRRSQSSSAPLFEMGADTLRLTDLARDVSSIADVDPDEWDALFASSDDENAGLPVDWAANAAAAHENHFGPAVDFSQSVVGDHKRPDTPRYVQSSRTSLQADDSVQPSNLSHNVFATLELFDCFAANGFPGKDQREGVFKTVRERTDARLLDLPPQIPTGLAFSQAVVESDESYEVLNLDRSLQKFENERLLRAGLQDFFLALYKIGCTRKESLYALLHKGTEADPKVYGIYARYLPEVTNARIKLYLFNPYKMQLISGKSTQGLVNSFLNQDPFTQNSSQLGVISFACRGIEQEEDVAVAPVGSPQADAASEFEAAVVELAEQQAQTIGTTPRRENTPLSSQAGGSGDFSDEDDNWLTGSGAK